MLWLLLFLLPAPLLAQTPIRIRVEASYVKVPVRVEDDRGQALLGLTKENFQVLDEGQPQPIDNFILDRTPLHVVLLLDVSGSVSEEIEEIKESAISFAEEFGKEDQIALITFAEKVDVLQSWTNNLRKLKKSLRKIEPGYRTAMYDALVQTRQKLDSRTGKRVVILLTDGVDNESQSDYDKVLGDLQMHDISVFIVGRTRLVLPQVQRLRRVEYMNRIMKNLLKEDKNFVEVYFREKEAAIKYMAESTGGRALFPEKLSELRGAYKQIALELKNQYLLTFRQPANSTLKVRNIQVHCTVPFGRLYYRQQYVWNSRAAVRN